MIVTMKTVSGLNVREHHMVRRKRIAKEKKCVNDAWLALGSPELKTPAKVMLRRVSMGRLDRWDNLPSAFKATIDQLCEIAGIDDGRDDLLKVDFDQVKPRKRGQQWIEIEWEAES